MQYCIILLGTPNNSFLQPLSILQIIIFWIITLANSDASFITPLYKNFELLKLNIFINFNWQNSCTNFTTINCQIYTIFPTDLFCCYTTNSFQHTSSLNPLGQGWGTCSLQAKCGSCEHLIWHTTLEFSLLIFEYNIALKQSPMISRYLDGTSTGVIHPHT